MNKVFNFLMLTGIVFATGFSCNVVAAELSYKEISKAYYTSYRYETSGNIEDAIKAIQLVYSQYPDTYTVNNRLAHLYTLNKQYKNAVSHYKKAVQVLPNSITPKLGLMYVYILSEQYKEVTKIGYQVLKVDYYNYFGNLRLAHALRKTGKTELSEKLLKKILALYPSDTLFLTELGLLYFEQDNWPSARAIMQDVLILDPENVSARQVLLAIKK